jgi:PKHD-type hydroxylase
MNLENYYWYFSCIVPERICDEIVKFGMSHKQKPAAIGLTTVKEEQGIPLTQKDKEDAKAIRDSNVVFLDDTWIHKELVTYIKMANYNAGWNVEWSKSEAMQFTQYFPNQYYHWHCDAFKGPYKKPEWRKGLIRKLSAVLSLTDPKEYEGGELQFDFRDKDKSEVRTCIEAKGKGSIVVFPSFVWHRVRPVTKGTRHSLVMWNLGNPYV